MRIIKIGDGFFFFIFFQTKETKIRIARIAIPLMSGEIPSVMVVKCSKELNNIVIAVARIKATMHGRTPFKNA